MNKVRIISILLTLVILFSFASFTPATAEEICNSSGLPAVTTDLEDYSPSDTVTISGSGFGCGETLSVLVTAPDGSTLSGDGTGAPGPDLVTSDENGEFVLSYQLYGTLPDGNPYTGQEGQYSIEVLDISGTVLASAYFSDGLGSLHTCALTTQGGVKCWGDNYWGQLGDGSTTDSTTPGDVNGLTSGVAMISAGSNHTCALMESGDVKCWGANFYGQLGNGITYQSRSTIPVDVIELGNSVIQIRAGGNYTCALMANGGVKCWGNNIYGQLGIGITGMGSGTPVDVSGLSSGVTQISVGFGHTCALMDSGGLKCWGRNYEYQLGDGTAYYFQTTPVYVVVYVPDTGFVPLSGVVQVSAGTYHTCALMANGGLKCWGNNDYGQLGDGSTVRRSTPVSVIGLESGMLQISAGTNYTCALTAGGGAKCWGNNGAGKLGDGTLTTRYTPVDVYGLAGGVAQISTGSSHTCALTVSGGAKCWGHNYYGQLGAITPTWYSNIPVDVDGLTSGVAQLPDNLPISNYPPSASAGGPYLRADNTIIQFDGSGSTDPDDDPLTYAWDFGDGNLGTGEIPTHHYTYPGIYDVCLTVNDGELDSAPDCTMAVIYDPQGGFVTGGGWIDSPAGALSWNPTLTGKANFGFVSEYKKGAHIPSGQTEFQFKAGDLNFHSTSYEWLVVNQDGTNAQFKGEGYINFYEFGTPYKFMVWATDQDPTTDTFRIKIWYESDDDELVIYDNGFGQPIDGGSIQVHVP